MDRGLLQVEGQDVILFCVNSVSKTFLDTIEEVSGKEGAKIVMEAAGYRTGKIICNFFGQNTKELEEVINILPSIYKSSGWGVFNILEFSLEKEAVVELIEDWEWKINRLQNKTEPGNFVAAHWAGILSEVFRTNIWYEITKHPLYGNDAIQIKLFPSKITPTENIKELLLGKERADITRLEAIVEDRTRDSKKLVQDLSSPIIPVLENIVVVPLMGQFDENRSSELIEKTLQGVMQYRATIIIFDVTGMNELDGHVLSLLENVTQAVSLVGATPVIVGITPELSIHLVKRGVYLRDLKCFATLKHAVHYGLALEGLQITSK